LNQDGSILAVGAWNNDDAGADAGHAQVFGFNGTDWIQMGQDLRASLPGDRFGWYVSLSDDGRTVAVSARLGDLPSENKFDAGYVRVFTYNGNLSQSNNSEWLQLGSDLEGEATGDKFGKTVSLSANGRRLAVGASQGAGGKGRIRVFDFDGDVWDVMGQALDGENVDDWQSGALLSADGSVLAVSAAGTGDETGLVRVYEFTNSTWTQRGQTLVGEEVGDLFGGNFFSLSGDGNCLAVGANHYSTDRGKGYLFRWNNSQWNEIASINGENPGGRLAYSIAVSGNCSWLAVGAPEYDESHLAPEGSSSSGYVLAYQVLKE
jgi:hypothetical protein